MDCDTILCFKDLNIRQKQFEKKLEDVINVGAKNKTKIVLNVEPLDKSELYLRNVKELSEKATQLQAEEFALLKEQNECSKHIADINKTIGALEETLQMLKDEESLGKGKLKQIKKPLSKAIKKYSTSFNFDIEVKRDDSRDDSETFVASVKFFRKEDINVVEFLIDRKNRKILDIKAESVLSEDEIQELKNIAPGENGLNIDLALNKLRHIL